jgi:sugar lactone lactonase YvrE
MMAGQSHSNKGAPVIRRRYAWFARALLACCVAAFWLAAPAGAYIYWGNIGTGSIGRANLDGSGSTDTFITGANTPYGVAVDGQHIYWVNNGTHQIAWANLDGSGARFIASGVDAPVGIAVYGSYLYVASVNKGIARANLDGSMPNTGFIPTALGPWGVAAGAAGVYWASSSTSTVGRANLDGSGSNNGFISSAATPNGVAIDGQYVYWANDKTNTIGRANLDGSNANQNFITGASNPGGVAVDAHYVYWTNTAANTIGRANLDGSSVDQNFITGANRPSGLAVDAAAPSASLSGASPSGAALSLVIACSGVVGQLCVGDAVVTSREFFAVRARHRQRPNVNTVIVAQGSYAVPAGATGTLVLALNPIGKRLLARAYRLPATVTLSGASADSRTITFSYRKINVRTAEVWKVVTPTGYTLYSEQAIRGLPRGARIVIRCTGPGCPSGKRVFRRLRSQIDVANPLGGAHLLPRATVLVQVTAPNEVGEVKIFTIRYGAEPAVSYLCVPPGARHPLRCAR